MRKTPITLRRERPLYIVSEILDEENVAHARTAGADEVIETTRLGFSMLTHAIVQHGSADIMGKITAAGAHSLYLGRPPAELELPVSFGEVSDICKRQYGVLVIGVHRTAIKTDQLNPPDELRVTSEMQLIYLGIRAVLPE
jgi:Trk K+ transport system NAD-binding subunit